MPGCISFEEPMPQACAVSRAMAHRLAQGVFAQWGGMAPLSKASPLARHKVHGLGLLEYRNDFLVQAASA